jgi:hypothetical protein
MIISARRNDRLPTMAAWEQVELEKRATRFPITFAPKTPFYARPPGITYPLSPKLPQKPIPNGFPHPRMTNPSHGCSWSTAIYIALGVLAIPLILFGIWRFDIRWNEGVAYAVAALVLVLAGHVLKVNWGDHLMTKNEIVFCVALVPVVAVLILIMFWNLIVGLIVGGLVLMIGSTVFGRLRGESGGNDENYVNATVVLAVVTIVPVIVYHLNGGRLWL